MMTTLIALSMSSVPIFVSSVLKIFSISWGTRLGRKINSATASTSPSKSETAIAALKPFWSVSEASSPAISADL